MAIRKSRIIKVSFRNNRSKIHVFFSVGVIFGIIFLIFLNRSTFLSLEEAEERIRIVFEREITRRLIPSSEIRVTHQIGLQLQEELSRVRDLEFVSLDIKKLILDFVLSPHRPTHIVRAVLRDDERQYPPRYFWLSWSNFDREVSRIAWYFSL